MYVNTGSCSKQIQYDSKQNCSSGLYLNYLLILSIMYEALMRGRPAEGQMFVIPSEI